MRLQNKQFFIVEDNLLNRITYQILLVREGAHVQFERWGPDAVNYLRRNPNFDLIILDLMLLRGENGYHLFEEIRKIPELARVPIIAVSAAPAEAMAKCQALGFSGYIAKPIDEQRFPQQLERVLNGEAVWSIG